MPFLALLRIDVKSMFTFMVPLCVWAWLMHWVDLSFNIMPVPHPERLSLAMDLARLRLLGFHGRRCWPTVFLRNTQRIRRFRLRTRA